jgi:hypothetical protein
MIVSPSAELATLRPDQSQLADCKGGNLGQLIVTKSACYTTVDSLGLPFIKDQVVTVSSFQKCGNVSKRNLLNKKSLCRAD